MLNTTQKFGQTSIVFKKQGHLSDKLETFLSSNYYRVGKFSTENLHTFPTYQCLQNSVQDFFLFL